MTGMQIFEEQRKTFDWKVDLLGQTRKYIQKLGDDWGATGKSITPAIRCHRRIHLAVFTEPYLTLVLQQKKTLESRFSVNRRAPFQEVATDDILLLKLSGGPILGIATVGKATHLHISSPEELVEIADRYGTALCIEDSGFWKQRQNAAYCTLIELRNVEHAEFERVQKRDRLGWVVLQREQMDLFWESA
jgi:hypothetical protein